MRRWHSRWTDVLAPLGEAGWELARAEFQVVSSEVRHAGRKLLEALLLLAVGLFALFWSIGALALVVVEGASLWMPRWAAALLVLGLFLLTGLALTLIARRRLRSIEPPTETVKRRLGEHQEWWDQKIAATRRRKSRRFEEGESSAGTDPDPS